jgi:heme/copper-type cytochrome/quinol oxidase subunit 2
MSDLARRIRWVVHGLTKGFVGGVVVGYCLLILLWIVCSADGGGFNSQPKHKWVEIIVDVAGKAILILAPLTGCIVGMIWAIRRNRRDEARPAPP